MLSYAALKLTGTRINVAREQATYFFSMQSPNIVICGAAFFMWFKETEMKYSKAVNSIAKVTFGIYLIHDHPFIRTLLWQKLFKLNENVNEKWFIPYTIGIVFAVFIVCGIIEAVRMLIFDKLNGKIAEGMEKVVYKVRDKVIGIAVK